MIPFADPIVDTSALWKIIVAAFAGGAGVAVVFGIGLLALQNASKTNNDGTRVFNYVLVGLAAAFCVAAIVLGIYAMTQKS
jgi:hypothetical protein